MQSPILFQIDPKSSGRILHGRILTRLSLEEIPNWLHTFFNDLAPGELLSPAFHANRIWYQSFFADLVRVGAVYLNTLRLSSQTSDPKMTLESGNRLRIHLEPKRYQCPTDLCQRLIYLDKEFLVYNKPAGVPVHPTVDNSGENLLAWLRESLGGSLWLLHRLDVPTRGVLIFARQRHLVHKAASGKVLAQKMYRAWTMTPVPLGVAQHYMWSGPRNPRRVTHQQVAGTKVCRLRVDSSEPYSEGGYLSTIELLTGRTHQVRCQLAALGSPIVGDLLYGGQEWQGTRAESMAQSMAKSTEPRLPWKFGLEATAIQINGKTFSIYDVPLSGS